MDFGMISYTGLAEADFILPDIPQPYLTGIKNKNPKLYLGLSTWTYKEEERKKNSPHPQPGTLPFYANHFNAVELNATYDNIISAEQFNKWYNSVKAIDFKFCPVFYKGIIQQGTIGLHKTGLTKDFIERMIFLKEKLGPSLFQLNETHTADTKDKLIEYLKVIPREFELSVEIRNAAWLADKDRFSSFVGMLNNLNKGIVITDTPGIRDAAHMQLSNSTAFIRFNCQGDTELDMFRIEQWKKQLRSWYLQGLENCYFFLHIHNKAYEADFAYYVQQELVF